ncbi:hypothetical protein [Phenylobacterium sp.]|uniref:hypothetical protein n=1 Tax=Phenylobacterium sp. TaxID=1871053 RepID=UPI00271BF3BF|nr:hypothetical protein [Phenylobacterium sp.]MDO8380133.1 hypothetical protein [Phenylobacterium sp.]
MLLALRTGRVEPSTGESIVRFQLRLFDALSRLERLYFAIKHEQKRLIAAKARYAPKWFSRRMATLDARGKLLRAAVGIGRALGDGFAWFFYERDRNLVAEHLAQERQILLPTGVGGQGERAMLENLQGIGRMLLIYHGTTSFLRMGDVSFVDLKTLRVAAIGELKTQRINERALGLKLALISGRRDLFPDLTQMRRSTTPPRPLDPNLEAKLKRQTKRMGDAFGRARTATKDPVRDSEGKFHFTELDDVISRAGSRRPAYAKAGPSLVVGAMRYRRGRSLSARLSTPPSNPNRAFGDVVQWATSILPPAFTDNALLLGRVSIGDDGPGVTADAIPMACWPLPDDALRALVFGEVLLLTLYNPAHFWAALRERGFSVTLGERASVRRAVRTKGDQELHLEHADYFHGLVQRSFVSLESVLGMVDQLLDLTEEKAAEGFRKIQMRPLVTRGPVSLES